MMKRISSVVFAFAMLAMPAFSQSFTQCPATMFTPNIGLSLPALGTQNWNLCLNPNFQVIDRAIGLLQAPFQGPWSSTTVYSKGSYVSFSGAIYISAINSNFNNTPTSGSAWTLFSSTSGGGGGGSCGPASGDPTNTDCGTGNQAGLASTPPGNITTYGDNNVADSSNSTFTVAIGNDNYNGDTNGSSDVIAIGDANATTTGQDLFKTILIGLSNMGLTTCVSQDFVGVGDTNFSTCPGNTIKDVVDIGDHNNDYSVASSVGGRFNDIVAIGVDNDEIDNSSIGVGSHQEVVSIGDTTASDFDGAQDVVAIGDFTGQSSGVAGVSVQDIVAIGDVAGEGLPNGSTADVYIGVAPGEIGGSKPGSPTETIGIGDSAADNSVGDENIAIGDSALDGGAGTPRGNTGHNNIALGFDAIRANTTGSDNVAIGDQPGCVGCTGSNNGQGNLTGSSNVWIGNDAGPSVANTTEIDFSIAIGFQSQNVASNEARFGAQVETFDTYLFGTIHTAAATVPTASTGTLVGTNNGGAISGLSAATSVTVTFAGGAGFQVWNACTANASAASTPVAVSAISLTSVTFSFPSLTGSLYFHCDGS